ncbi:ABC transporter permease [Bombilactobacillus thymidiniphilus]|uniref:ABC transporter permease n=1 Tax=Bombilactobacillus thymidiniphilus TaxID=2923363 RepID=A0ABY4PF05_9LACO|nr:ABC transporter permease [Bombilactobacillus thymidiniphilus]UQS84106.1 ABC transporter permease [Bombilactobacillus thymidiniphilus]
MLNKLALNGCKSRWKDYLVLFSGLLISTAIFYMFQVLAMNKQFLKSNSPISVTPIVFHLGTFLLILITIVYVLYANTFLMSMRKKEYGMFIVLGSKTRTIRSLVMIETLFIGLISTIVGMLVGIGLTQVVARLLARQLQANLAHLQTIYPPAIGVTILVFGLLFLFAALKNSWHIGHQPLLSLLKDQQKADQIAVKFGVGQTIQLLAGIVCLVIGYWSLGQLQNLQMTALMIASVTIILGTYWTINTLFRAIINVLRHSQFALQGLHSFTLGQLNFRIVDYTKILSMISILFALAMGAVTVGLSFQQNVQMVTEQSEYYDVVINNATTNDRHVLKQLPIKSNLQYKYKIVSGQVYFKRAQFQAHAWQQVGTPQHKQAVTATIKQLQTADSVANYHFNRQLIPQAYDKPMHWVSQQQFAQLVAPTNQVQFMRVNDFSAQISKIQKIVHAQQQRYPRMKSEGATAKVASYAMVNEMFSGLEFMGFFLGFAFLAMLASCLMFKILSSADQDRMRYQMLHKIGARSKVLKHSINQELGVLFGIPAVIGIIHVLFGMQIFSLLLQNPYHHIWLPILLFSVLYGLYYLLTTALYKLIVLKNK